MLVTDGSFEVNVEGNTISLTAGELIYIPYLTAFKFVFTAVYSQAYLFASGGGIERIIRALGNKYDPPTIPDVAVGDWTDEQVKELGDKLGYTLQ